MNVSRYLVALAIVTFGLTACSSPRLVRGITSRADEVKFLYYEGGATGVVKCRLGPDGVMADCRPMKITLED